jgi:hypothetical protein
MEGVPRNLTSAVMRMRTVGDDWTRGEPDSSEFLPKELIFHVLTAQMYVRIDQDSVSLVKCDFSCRSRILVRCLKISPSTFE